MELVYLWVKNYKNIVEQGFNFSPRFRCEYDEEKNELKVVDKDKTGEFYPKNFFGNNINITAIVGENGSGKSSLLDVLESYIMRNILVYYDRLGTFYYIADIEDVKSIGIKIEKGNINYLEKSIFLSWDILGNNISNCYTKYLQKKENHLLFISEYEKINNLESNFTLSAFEENVLISIFDYSKKTNKPIFDFIPKFISIEIKTISKLNLDKQENEKEIIGIVNSLISKIENELEKNIEKNFIDGIDFNIKEYFLLFLCKKYEASIDLSKIEKDNIFENLEQYFCDNIFIQIFTQDIFESLEKFSIKIIGIMTEFFMLSNKYLIEEFKKIYEDNKELFTFLIEVGFIKLNYEDEEEKNFLNLSFGERTIFLQSLFIEKEIKEIEETNSGIEDIFLFFDEIDVSLHPYWQKKQIIELINLLSQYNELNNKKKFHLIISSHSPFILSDLPKQNVIFLEKDEKTGKCVNATEKMKDLNTFGANIHTLLSHGFFMKDGLMGEFAKSKIDKAIEYLNKTKLNDKEISYCENIISIIGEPIIKRELQRKLDSKRLSKIDKINEIEEQMKLLAHRLEMIRKNQK